MTRPPGDPRLPAIAQMHPGSRERHGLENPALYRSHYQERCPPLRSVLILGNRTLVGFRLPGLLLLLLGELPLLPLLDDVAPWLHAATYLEVVLIVVAPLFLSHVILTM